MAVDVTENECSRDKNINIKEDKSRNVYNIQGNIYYRNSFNSKQNINDLIEMTCTYFNKGRG